MLGQPVWLPLVQRAAQPAVGFAVERNSKRLGEALKLRIVISLAEHLNSAALLVLQPAVDGHSLSWLHTSTERLADSGREDALLVSFFCESIFSARCTEGTVPLQPVT